MDFCSEIPLDEVGAILHHHAQLAMPFRALPLRHEVQAMHALVALAVLDARLTRELDAPCLKQRSVRVRVDHLDLRSILSDHARADSPASPCVLPSACTV